jgi:PRC-barrel domain
MMPIADGVLGASARGIVGGREILGLPVIDSRGERVGTLADIMFDLHTGRIAYGIVALDRVPRWTERMVAIPWNAMHLGSDDEHLCVNARRDWIERTPSVQAQSLPSILDHDRAVLIHSFFGTKPYWEAGSRQHS